MAGKEYIIPLGVDATNVINPMSQVIETMEKTENVSRGTKRTIADQTLGGGWKAPGPTVNNDSTRQRYCNITDKRP